MIITFKNSKIREENFTHGEFVKYLSVYNKTMKKAGKYARPIGFAAKIHSVVPMFTFLFLSPNRLIVSRE